MATIKLDTNAFKEQVFDYSQKKEWNYQGDKPAIIDFYADWCGPCKAIAPILEELSKEFQNDIYIYKVDTEAEDELSAVFDIRSIPSLLFVPMDGPPMMQQGALPKQVMQQVIREELLNSEEPKED